MDKSWINTSGKENGLFPYFFKNYVPTERYENPKIFVKHIDDETANQLTLRIYNLIESWFLHNRTMPQMIVLTKQDYIMLLNDTDTIEDNHIFGMEIDFFKKNFNKGAKGETRVRNKTRN